MIVLLILIEHCLTDSITDTNRGDAYSIDISDRVSEYFVILKQVKPKGMEECQILCSKQKLNGCYIFMKNKTDYYYWTLIF